MKTIALVRESRHRGITKVGWLFTFAVAANNPVRLGICWQVAPGQYEGTGESCPHAQKSSKWRYKHFLSLEAYVRAPSIGFRYSA
jgi:hypothetical protein